MTDYRKKQVIDVLKENRIVDINGPNLAYYLKLGIVTPDVANPSGRAEIKYYSVANLVDIAIARTLENHGLTLKAISKVMDSIRGAVRSSYKELKNVYRLHLIIANPNTENSKPRLQKCMKKEYQMVKRPVAEQMVSLDMDDADSYLVVDLSKLIARMTPLF